jgi:hypothetical protein
MQRVKDKGVEFCGLLVDLEMFEATRVGTARAARDNVDYVPYKRELVEQWPPTGLTWELQNARRGIEEAVMWAVKQLTK